MAHIYLKLNFFINNYVYCKVHYIVTSSICVTSQALKSPQKKTYDIKEKREIGNWKLKYDLFSKLDQ